MPTRKRWMLPISAAFLWLASPFKSITTKCLLTSVRCTRWGPQEGADFGHPLTTALLQLLVVGLSLAVSIAVRDAVTWCCRKCEPHPRNGPPWDNNDNNGETRMRNGTGTVSRISSSSSSSSYGGYGFIDRFSLFQKAKLCSFLGASFGAKHIVGHLALQATPTPIYVLFHCLNIVWIAIFGWILNGERVTSKHQLVSCLGVVVGSIITAAEGFVFHDDHRGGGSNKPGFWALLLNLANGVLAGVVVGLLRWTTLKMDEVDQLSIMEMTCLKMLIGAIFVLPFAMAFEGVDAMLTLNEKQDTWLWISSAAILFYHLNLTFLCSLATTIVIGIIESIKPLPAFVITVMMQGLPHKSVFFWVGAVTTLLSAIMFKLGKTIGPCLSKYQMPTRANEIEVDTAQLEVVSLSGTNNEMNSHEESFRGVHA